MWFALLRRLGSALTGRRITVRGVVFTVVSLHGRPDGSAWTLGRARDAHVVLGDVTAPEFAARELVVECDTLVVGSTVTATGVTVTATMSPESLQALGDANGESRDVHIVDGEVRARWFPGVDVVVRPEVAADRLRFVPVALITPAGRWSSPRWLPAGTAAPPELPGGLRLAEIATTDDAVVLRATIDRWTAALGDVPWLRELLGAASQTSSRSTEPDVAEG